MKHPVYTEEDENRFNAVLREIQSRIPHDLLKAAIVEKKVTPTIELIMEKALESDIIAPEKKEAIRRLLASGEFSKAAPSEVPKVTKMIDNFVSREINKAIKAGKLPPRSHVKYLPSMLKIQKEKDEAKNQ